MSLSTSVVAGQLGHAGLHNEERAAVNTLVGQLDGRSLRVVSELPAEPDPNTIYFVGESGS
jgi:hypothetical protein